jgi:uncharacterized protein YbbK (DUF523 family)
MTERVRIGISRCLLGDAVRYDGGDKRDVLVLEEIGPEVEWVSVCPEVEIGMGTPREPIDLIPAGDGLHMIGQVSGNDWTAPMRHFAAGRVASLRALGLSGYILKSGSPSCGLEGPGLFARALMDALPDLPIADERQLQDAAARTDFLARVRAYRG